MPILLVAFGVSLLTQSPQTSRPLDRVLITTEILPKMREVMAQSDPQISPTVLAEAGLTRTKSEKFDFFIEQRLWDPPRLISAIETLKMLSVRDISKPVKLRDLPSSTHDYLMKSFSTMVRNKDGEPKISLDSDISLTSQIKLEVQLRGKKVNLAWNETNSGSPAIFNPSPDQLSSISPIDPPKSSFEIHMVKQGSDALYWKAVTEASELLVSRRKEWQKKYVEAYRTFLSHLLQLDKLEENKDLIGPASKLRTSLQSELLNQLRKERVDLSELKDISILSADRVAYFSLAISDRVKVSFTPEMFFDIP